MAIEIQRLSYARDPGALDVEVKIRGANWWPSDEDQIKAAQFIADMAVRGSIARFLKIVRWEPFICSGEVEERYFNRVDEQGRIELGEGLLDLASVTIMGRSYTVNETVFAQPDNARTKRKPYTSLLLWPLGWGSQGCYEWREREMRPRSIVVTGKWGYAFEWPEDAYDAIVSRAAAITLSSVNQESDLAGISQDGFSEQYDLVGPVDQKTALSFWGKEFDDIAKSYARSTPGPRSLNTGSSAARNARNVLPIA